MKEQLIRFLEQVIVVAPMIIFGLVLAYTTDKRMEKLQREDLESSKR